MTASVYSEKTRLKKLLMMMKMIIIIVSIMNKSQETTFFHGRQKLTSAMKQRQARTQDFEKGGSGYRMVGHDEGEGAGARSFYTMDDLECQIFIQIKLQKQ